MRSLKNILSNYSFFCYFFYLMFFINFIVDFSNMEIFIMLILFSISFYKRRISYFMIALIMYIHIYETQVGGYGGFFFINFVFFTFLLLILYYKAISFFIKQHEISMTLSSFFLNIFYLLFPSFYFHLFYFSLLNF